MITKALVSFAEGQDYRNLLNVAIPSFYDYSNLYNYDLIIPSHKFVLDSCHEFGYKYGERASSWLKIPIIKSLIKKYDVVLWIDCDVVITKFDMDISENFINSKYIQGFVQHHVSKQYVPNMGVWLLNNNSNDLLSNIWNKHGLINHPWWEQQANITLMNWDINKNTQDQLSQYGQQSLILPYEWNVHKNDSRYNLEYKNGRFMHSTMWPNRLKIMKEWACQE
jgi:hypothetical protein